MSSCGVSGVKDWKHTVLAWEEGLSAQHFCQNAAHAPHVNGFGVLLEGEHNLGRTVPSRRNIFRHEARIILGRSGRSSETKVTDLEVAVGVEKEIGGFEVAVEYVGGMHGLECTEGLIDEVLTVIIGKVLSPDNAMHVGLHELLQRLVVSDRLMRESCGRHT